MDLEKEKQKFINSLKQSIKRCEDTIKIIDDVKTEKELLIVIFDNPIMNKK